MAWTRRLLSLWAFSHNFSSTTPLFMRLLVSMAAITLLAVFAAVLMAMVLAGAIWLAYAQLVAHGVTVAVAALLIGSALLALLLAAFMAMRHYWCRATNACSQMITRQSPISGRVSQVCDAFLQGFNKG